MEDAESDESKESQSSKFNFDLMDEFSVRMRKFSPAELESVRKQFNITPMKESDYTKLPGGDDDEDDEDLVNPSDNGSSVVMRK